MKKLFILIIVVLLIFSGCVSNTIAEKFGKIPIQELPKEYMPDIAIENGDYVNFHGEISNENVMNDFLEKVDKNEEAYIRTVQYTIEGDPLINDFYYAKNKFTVTTDNSRDRFGGKDTTREEKEFKYLKTVEIGNYSYLIVTNLEEIPTNSDIYFEGFYLPNDSSIILKEEMIKQ